jgi:Zn-dependent peptidase ImmA (M78 family)/transcriptional regulator with XRE-family HTH domain
MTTDTFDRGRLRLARELVGWNQARLAAAADISAAALSQFESGSTRPRPETLQRLATELGVPAGFFFQPLVESHEGFFRSLRRTPLTERRRARAIAHLAHDAVTHPAAQGVLPAVSIPYLPAPSTDLPDDVEAIAAEVRAAWRVPSGPIANVVDLLEDHGIAVVRLPLSTADVDAFSLPFEDNPVIVLGSDKNDKARSRFDGSHELGHLVMHAGDIWGTALVEKQAHQFAAAFLMPRDEIIDELPRSADWAVLFKLKQRWQVSLAALLMRAKVLGRMKEATYLTAVKTASARGWRRLEPIPLGEPEQPARLIGLLRGPIAQRLRENLPAGVITSITAATAGEAGV